MKYSREDGCLAWLTTGKLSSIALSKVFSAFKSAEIAYDRFCSGDAWFREYLTKQQNLLLRTNSSKDKMHQMLLVMQKNDIGVIDINHIQYPDNLRSIPDPPMILFYQGNLDCMMERSLTIIGSRKASSSTIDDTVALAEELAENGVTIVSGLAMGIDAAAHRGAVNKQSPTAAVLACGIDLDYPVENLSLRREILRHDGLILSEYALGTTAMPYNFEARNRIMSGLSQGLVVMECGLKSGCMMTVTHALEQGREVHAYPGLIHTEYAQGTHRLLREGASYFTTAADILEDYGWNTGKPKKSASVAADLDLPGITPLQHLIMKQLATGEKSFDQLVAALEVDTSELSGALTILQIMGYIKTKPGKIYAKA